MCDTNLAAAVLPNGSLVGVWRHCETVDLVTMPHTLIATGEQPYLIYLGEGIHLKLDILGRRLLLSKGDFSCVPCRARRYSAYNDATASPSRSHGG